MVVWNRAHRRLPALLSLCFVVAVSPIARSNPVRRAEENDYYRLVSIVTSQAPTESRSKFWKPAPDGLALEVSGLAVIDDWRLAVAIRKGEVWLLDGVYEDPPENVTCKQFASALHEPLGLLKHGDSFYTVQRSELTRLRDTDGDEVADEYLTVAKGWGTTANYHEYAYRPKLDRDGNLWLTLNIGMGISGEQQARLVREPTLGVAQAPWRGGGHESHARWRTDSRVCRHAISLRFGRESRRRHVLYRPARQLGGDEFTPPREG